METLVIDKHDLLDFLEEKLKGRAKEGYYFIGVSKEGFYDGFSLSKSYPGIKILEFDRGFDFTDYNYLYKLFLENDEDNAIWNLWLDEVPAVWEDMTTDEKVNWVFDNVNSWIIEKFFNISWNNDYADIISEIEDSLRNFKFTKLPDRYIVKINN